MATLTFVYAESTAVVGPLATSVEPHSWDLCDDHARRITVPRGWDMLRSERGFSAPLAEDHELTALAEAVREVELGDAGSRVAGGRPLRGDARFGEGFADHIDGVDDRPRARHRAGVGRPDAPAAPAQNTGHPRQPVTPRPGRRGHLRVLPDPVD